MHKKLYTLALTGLLTIGLATGVSFAQDDSAAPPPPSSPPQAEAQAPGMHGHRMNPDAQLKHMTKQLNLSADQQSQIKPLLDARQQQMQALWQDQSLSRQDRRQRMMSIQQDTSSKIEATLNDDQKTKFEAMQEKMKERRMQRMQGDQPPAPPNAAPPADSAPPTPQQQ